MNVQLKESLDKWISDNLLSARWINGDTISLDGFGDIYVLDDTGKKCLIPYEIKGETFIKLNIQFDLGELIGDDIFYCVFKFGDNFYYTDLREPFELKIFKNIGKCTAVSEYPFVNLGVHTQFDLLNGTSSVPDWVNRVKFLEQKAIGVCDTNTLASSFILQKECKNAGIKHIFGYSLSVKIPAVYEEEVRIKDAIKFNGKVYSLTNEGWANMLRIQKNVMVDNYMNPHIDFNELLSLSSGNIFVIDKMSIKTMTDYIVSELQSNFESVFYQWDMNEYKTDRIDKELLDSGKYFLDNWHDKIPAILIPDSYYIDKNNARCKIVANKISYGSSHSQSDEQYLKPQCVLQEQMEGLFKDKKIFKDFMFEITNNTVVVSEMAVAKIETGNVCMPEYEMLPYEIDKYGDKHNMFLQLIEDGLERLCVPPEELEKYRDRINSEKYVIESSNNVDYFLILWDIVNNARSHDVQLGAGRGSAAGSLISYLLHLTSTNPFTYSLIFERFLTNERCGLIKKDVTVLSEDISLDDGDEYVEIETEDGTMKLYCDAEVMVKRGEGEITVYADDLEEGDDIIIDRKNEVWDIKNMIENENK